MNTLITSIVIEPTSTDGISIFESPLLAWNATLPDTMQKVLDVLKRFVSEYVVMKPEIQLLEYKGQQLVMELFQAFSGDPERLLPEDTKKRWRIQCERGHDGHRVICDYIAGMTDGFAQRLHARMFSADHDSGWTDPR